MTASQTAVILWLNHFNGIQVAIKTFLEEERIVDIVKKIAGHSFTILDFVTVFKELYPEDWQR